MYLKRICDICEKDDKKVLYQQKHNMIKYDVVVCNNCGFVFADNVISGLEIDEYYKRLSKYENNNTTKEHNYKIFNFLRFKNKEADILDIGCATGGLLEIFFTHGYHNVVGSEISEKCCEIVNKKGIECINSDIENLQINKKFDLIILSSVLEHLTDLNKAMKKVKSLLKPRGLLFIEIPMATRFFKSVPVPYQQFSSEHLNFFSHWSIDNLYSKYNLQKIDLLNEMNCINRIKDPCLFLMLINNEFMIKGDQVCETNIKLYIENSENKSKQLALNLCNSLIKEDKVIVWGAGALARYVIENELFDIDKIAYIVDSNENYKGLNIKGKYVKKPKEIDDNYPILILSYGHQFNIEKSIQELGLTNKVIKAYE
jgi:SAM-dependent methyltransferase